MNVRQRPLPDADSRRKLQLNSVLRLLIVQLSAQTLAQDACAGVKSSEVRIAFADQINRIPGNNQVQRQHASQKEE